MQDLIPLHMQQQIKKYSQIHRKLIWLEVGFFAFLVHHLLGNNSKLVETIYSRGFYIGLRWLWDYTVGLSPIPLIHLFVIILVGWMLWKISRSRASRNKRVKSSWPTRIIKGVLSVFALAGAVVFLFYVLWGFNYNRITIERHLKLDTVPLDLDALRAEANLATQMAAESRTKIPGSDQEALNAGFFPKNLESKLRVNLSQILRAMNYPIPGRVRARKFWPGDVFMRFSISGIYIPFFGEGYTSGSLLPVEMPFTLAHELAHGFGFADEGNANFLAYLACEISEDHAIKYSGRLAYWSYVINEFFKVGPEEYRALWDEVPIGMKADVKAVTQNWNRFRGKLTKIGRRVNERYLKSQGISEGLKSYNRLVVLVSAWRKKQNK